MSWSAFWLTGLLGEPIPVADYSEAIRLSPHLAGAFEIEPEEAMGYYGRAMAKKGKGDEVGSDIDNAAATALQTDIGSVFAALYGE